MRLVSGEPSYANVLDAVSAWQLVHEAARSLERPAATSFKHVSPAGAAVAGTIDAAMEAIWGVDAAALSNVASAYLRARDCDPKSSFGDVVAVSEPVDSSRAAVLATVISDGIIAPGFEPGVVEVFVGPRRVCRAVMRIEEEPASLPRRSGYEVGIRPKGCHLEVDVIGLVLFCGSVSKFLSRARPVHEPHQRPVGRVGCDRPSGAWELDLAGAYAFSEPRPGGIEGVCAEELLDALPRRVGVTQRHVDPTRSLPATRDRLPGEEGHPAQTRSVDPLGARREREVLTECR